MSTQNDRCTAEWLRPRGASLWSPRGVITTSDAVVVCQRESGHDGKHEAVVPDESAAGLQYRMTWGGA